MRVRAGQVLYLVLNQASHSSRSEPMTCKRISETIIFTLEKLDCQCKALRRQTSWTDRACRPTGDTLQVKKHCFVCARRHGEEAASLSLICDGTRLHSLFSPTSAPVHALQSISAPLSAERARLLKYDGRLGLLKLARRLRWDALLVLDAPFGSRRRWTGFSQREGDFRTATTQAENSEGYKKRNTRLILPEDGAALAYAMWWTLFSRLLPRCFLFVCTYLRWWNTGEEKVRIRSVALIEFCSTEQF